MNKELHKLQTAAWAPPAARDGTVPKTERGNVNVPPYAAALPEGAAHRPFGMATAQRACDKRRSHVMGLGVKMFGLGGIMFRHVSPAGHPSGCAILRFGATVPISVVALRSQKQALNS